MLGFGAAYEYPLTDPWAVVGFVDLSRRSGSDEDDGVEIDFSETITTFGAAARWNRATMGAFERLFAQAGFGVARSGFTDTISINGTEIDEFSDSETSPMFTFGAGVTRPFNDL